LIYQHQARDSNSTFGNANSYYENIVFFSITKYFD
jgi:hypothetical protein